MTLSSVADDAPAQIEELGEGRFRISGSLSFANARAVLLASRRSFRGAPALDIDLSAVARADSAGLSLLVEWSRVAQAAGQALTIRNAPVQLRSMASLVGVEALLGLAAA
jgi:phospholipid transport system transporter-binding protein